MNTHAPAEHVVFTDFDESEGVIVDLNTKKYYQLNETAMVIWRGLERGRTPPEIMEELTSTFDVSAEQAAASLKHFLGLLLAHKLVREV